MVAVAVTAGAMIINVGVDAVLEKFGVKDKIKDVGKSIAKNTVKGVKDTVKSVSNFFTNSNKKLAGYFG